MQDFFEKARKNPSIRQEFLNTFFKNENVYYSQKRNNTYMYVIHHINNILYHQIRECKIIVDPSSFEHTLDCFLSDLIDHEFKHVEQCKENPKLFIPSLNSILYPLMFCSNYRQRQFIALLSDPMDKNSKRLTNHLTKFLKNNTYFEEPMEENVNQIILEKILETSQNYKQDFRKIKSKFKKILETNDSHLLIMKKKIKNVNVKQNKKVFQTLYCFYWYKEEQRQAILESQAYKNQILNMKNKELPLEFVKDLLDNQNKFEKQLNSNFIRSFF